jgi:diacylglycerol kinase (ATP)
MSKITFIVNPSAGFGKTKKRFKSLAKEILEKEPQANIVLTRHAFHATSLAKEALIKGAERLVVIGGDGTLNEVVNGYFDQDGKPYNENASVGIIPMGTGSDFFRGFSKPHSNDYASIDFVLKSEGKPTDVGFVLARDNYGKKIGRYFINVSSMGLSGLVAGFMKTVTRKFGPKAAYFMATVQAIRALRPPTLLIEADGLKQEVENCSLLSMANGTFFGSGMNIAPHAQVDDGLLDAITIEHLSATFFLINGYRVYQGTHLDLANVHEYRKSQFSITALSQEPVYVETDGELFAQLPAQYRVLKRAISIVR